MLRRCGTFFAFLVITSVPLLCLDSPTTSAQPSAGWQQEPPVEEGPPRQSEEERAQAIQRAESEQYKVRQVEFVGNDNTRDQVTRRKLVMNEGNDFTQKDVAESLRRINRLGIFLPVKPSDVDFWLDHKNKEVDMLIRLVEKKSKASRKKN